ncbi:hypothetical protein GGR57DRAFT_23056 [Xylariaceae sp. FL1272]|nr:hypothetical protein GGR57DRAFT_23056 [Xylariaceae sp. FL1272]
MRTLTTWNLAMWPRWQSRLILLAMNWPGMARDAFISNHAALAATTTTSQRVLFVASRPTGRREKTKFYHSV